MRVKTSVPWRSGLRPPPRWQAMENFTATIQFCNSSSMMPRQGPDMEMHFFACSDSFFLAWATENGTRLSPLTCSLASHCAHVFAVFYKLAANNDSYFPVTTVVTSQDIAYNCISCSPSWCRKISVLWKPKVLSNRWTNILTWPEKNEGSEWPPTPFCRLHENAWRPQLSFSSTHKQI